MEKNTGRIEALSDGIFAVAITLLVLDIGVDASPAAAGSNQALGRELWQLWPKFAAYFNSFACVLLMWMVHHQMFKKVVHAGNWFILCNGLLLLVIALAPFPTKTMGEYVDTAARTAAVLLYIGYSLLLSLTYILLAYVARQSSAAGLVQGGAKYFADINKAMWMGVGLNTAILLVSYWAPGIGIFLSLCMWVFWLWLALADGKEA